MRILRAFGWLPVPVFYSDDLPEGFGGWSRVLWVVIRPKYENDLGLHEHELEHCEQGYRLLIVFHALLYKFSKRYRQWAEVKAYRRQIACYPAGTSIEFAVRALVNKYGLGLTEEKARQLLTA